MTQTFSVFRRKPAFSASMRAAGILIVINAVLFIAKVTVGVAYNSLAVLSDAGNSLTDVVTSIIILFAVRESAKQADAGHHFGHSRTEPLAAFTVAVLTCVLAAQVFREAVARLFSGGEPLAGIAPLLVLALVILSKSAIWVVAGRMGRKQRSPALIAAAMDAKMDVLISIMAMVGVAGVDVGLPWLDGVAALFIAAWIAYTGFALGKENVEKLLGAVPDPAIVRIIHAKFNLLKKQKRIRNFHELRIHYVGSEIHIAVHVNVNRELALQESHDLDEDIQAMLLSIPDVKHVALHIDPV
ncbi:cation diffusion facilitator family transporter [Candidatus Magnetaquicoccus inordinatus]|uniref:cation diffusion facilitator family transporter n=1 Tax=Candidatus Magnetaquicoccus inordinatus TaxID=2496818 RepID=UPI00187D140E|nr:cation diffusion facilitator family transporter [Candidatus Magnetaquicoccus inordinatus]